MAAAAAWMQALGAGHLKWVPSTCSTRPCLNFLPVPLHGFLPANLCRVCAQRHTPILYLNFPNYRRHLKDKNDSLLATAGEIPYGLGTYNVPGKILKGGARTAHSAHPGPRGRWVCTTWLVGLTCFPQESSVDTDTAPPFIRFFLISCVPLHLPPHSLPSLIKHIARYLLLIILYSFFLPRIIISMHVVSVLCLFQDLWLTEQK